jgi:AMMECR1 domain-containing protein
MVVRLVKFIASIVLAAVFAGGPGSLFSAAQAAGTAELPGHELTLPQIVKRTMALYFRRAGTTMPTPAGVGNKVPGTPVPAPTVVGTKVPTTPGPSTKVPATPGTAVSGTSFQEFADSLDVPPQFKQPHGVFVTLSFHGKTRACWGSVDPQHENVVKSTVYATLGALTKEYRFHPIRASEWQRLKPQVTIIKAVEPIDSIANQNPLRDGLLVRAGGRAAVLLPGEASDATYQLVQCKLKAGIQPKESCQLYRLRTDIYE